MSWSKDTQVHMSERYFLVSFFRFSGWWQCTFGITPWVGIGYMGPEVMKLIQCIKDFSSMCRFHMRQFVSHTLLNWMELEGHKIAATKCLWAVVVGWGDSDLMWKQWIASVNQKITCMLHSFPTIATGCNSENVLCIIVSDKMKNEVGLLTGAPVRPVIPGRPGTPEVPWKRQKQIQITVCLSVLINNKNIHVAS